MDKQNCKYKTKNHTNTMVISIRIPKEISQWITEQEYSPRAIFMEALKELGYKDKT